MGVSGQHHAPAALYSRGKDSGNHCTGCWVGPRAGLDTEDRGKILSPLPGIEPRSPGRPVRSQTLYWLDYPARLNFCIHRFFVRRTVRVKQGMTDGRRILSVALFNTWNCVTILERNSIRVMALSLCSDPETFWSYLVQCSVLTICF
jgi:hypothetical protein